MSENDVGNIFQSKKIKDWAQPSLHTSLTALL